VSIFFFGRDAESPGDLFNVARIDPPPTAPSGRFEFAAHGCVVDPGIRHRMPGHLGQSLHQDGQAYLVAVVFIEHHHRKMIMKKVWYFKLFIV
jgi:hypothetical protein